MARDSPAPCCNELDSEDEKKRGLDPTIFAKFRELLLISAEAAYIAGTERDRQTDRRRRTTTKRRRRSSAQSLLQQNQKVKKKDLKRQPKKNQLGEFLEF